MVSFSRLTPARKGVDHDRPSVSFCASAECSSLVLCIAPAYNDNTDPATDRCWRLRGDDTCARRRTSQLRHSEPDLPLRQWDGGVTGRRASTTSYSNTATRTRSAHARGAYSFRLNPRASQNRPASGVGDHGQSVRPIPACAILAAPSAPRALRKRGSRATNHR